MTQLFVIRTGYAPIISHGDAKAERIVLLNTSLYLWQHLEAFQAAQTG